MTPKPTSLLRQARLNICRSGQVLTPIVVLHSVRLLPYPCLARDKRASLLCLCVNFELINLISETSLLCSIYACNLQVTKLLLVKRKKIYKIDPRTVLSSLFLALIASTDRGQCYKYFYRNMMKSQCDSQFHAILIVVGNTIIIVVLCH